MYVKSWRGFGLTGLSAGLLLCLPGMLAAAENPKPVPRPVVTTAPEAIRKDLVRVLVSPVREAKLASQMSGRIVAMSVQEGGAFARGATLVEFDCEQQRAQQEAARAVLLRATSSLEAREELLKHSAVSDLDVTLARADQSEAQAHVRQADVAVRDCKVVAPYAGKVARRLANLYENVSQGTPLLEIQESAGLKLEALVPSYSLNWLQPGFVFTVHIDELDRDVQAVVTGIGSRIDPASQTVSIRAALKGRASGVLPGMSGSALWSRVTAEKRQP